MRDIKTCKTCKFFNSCQVCKDWTERKKIKLSEMEVGNIVWCEELSGIRELRTGGKRRGHKYDLYLESCECLPCFCDPNEDILDYPDLIIDGSEDDFRISIL